MQQTALPGRFFYGILPDALINQYQFWQNVDGSIMGEERSPSGDQRTRLFIKLLKTGKL